MASSRIFIKGLPPSITEADFKKHFAFKGKEVTDARLFANRRIGYVGYKTPEDAQAAVKYFNKTFVRMSRVGVEIARTVDEARKDREAFHGRAPTAQRTGAGSATGANFTERKQEPRENEAEEQDPKLKEFLEVMKPKSKKRAWESENDAANAEQGAAIDDQKMQTGLENASDDEYEEVPRQAKRAKFDKSEPATKQNLSPDAPAQEEPADAPDSAELNEESNLELDSAVQAPVSDADWARSRTSRLLGLLDEEEEETEIGRTGDQGLAEASDIEDEGLTRPSSKPEASQNATEPPQSIPTPPADDQPDAEKSETDVDATGVRASMRLFLRNLPFDVERSALEAEFSSYGNLEEVCLESHLFLQSTQFAR